MRSTDKKIIRRVIAVGILIAVILCMNHVAVLSFDRVRNADYFNYDMEQLEKQHADVDLMIVGASQVYHGCNPDVISAEMGIHEVVECASAASHNDGMYYMLKDLLGRFTPKCVVIDLTWSKFMDKNVPVLSMAKLLSADRMSWPRKLEYAAHNFNLDEWMKLLFPMYRYGGSVWGFSQLKANYFARKAVRAGNWVDESKRRYRKNGFTWVNAGCPQGSIPSEVVSYSNDLVSSYETDYMKKLWKLCDEKGVQVIWCTLPTSMVELYGIQNYQDSPDYMKAFAEELGCTYLNFNLLKGREAFLPDTCFSDKVHLNGTGSVAFSKVFAQAVKKVLDGEDPSGMFYENIDEMKKKKGVTLDVELNADDLKELFDYYFDMDRDYETIKNELQKIDSNMRRSILYGEGIRLLNQDLWETIISFIISANNNIPRIKGIIERISKRFGDKIERNGIQYYTFPTPEQLEKASVQDLRNLGLGFRDVRVFETTKIVLNKEIDLDKLHDEKNTQVVREELLKLPGVGPKVADCILLFSTLKRLDVFPIDVWVRRVMNELYIHNEDENKVDKKLVLSMANEKFGNLQGIAQQYLFYWKRG